MARVLKLYSKIETTYLEFQKIAFIPMYLEIERFSKSTHYFEITL